MYRYTYIYTRTRTYANTQKYGMGRIIEQEGVATSNVHMLLADMIMQTDQ